MVRERVRLQNELGGASEGIDKELADKLAFSSSLCRRMRRRHRRARQRQADAELQEALTRQQMSDWPTVWRVDAEEQKRRRHDRAARDAPTTTECKASFGKEAGEGGTSADLPRNDKEGSRSRMGKTRDTGGADHRRARKGWSTREKQCQGHDNVFLKNTVEKNTKPQWTGCCVGLRDVKEARTGGLVSATTEIRAPLFREVLSHVVRHCARTETSPQGWTSTWAAPLDKTMTFKELKQTATCTSSARCRRPSTRCEKAHCIARATN